MTSKIRLVLLDFNLAAIACGDSCAGRLIATVTCWTSTFDMSRIKILTRITLYLSEVAIECVVMVLFWRQPNDYVHNSETLKFSDREACPRETANQ